jgi:hypothetical protein
MVGAADALNQSIPNLGIDAVEGRQMDDLIATARTLQAEGALGQIVVVQMGANGTVSAAQFNTLMQLFGQRSVIVLNAKVPRWWQDPNDAVIAAGVKRDPHAVLIDWRAASSSHPDFFYEDGIHLRPEGATFYANLVASAISRIIVRSPGS